MKLYTYWRSSSSFRVRIALNWKGIAYQPVFVHLAKGEQLKGEHLKVNPQGLVPVLEDGGAVITQSTAIIEYLEEKHPGKPLLPKGTEVRAEVRSLVNLIACDIQPLNNLKVLKYLKNALGHGEDEIKAWYNHWISLNFAALEKRIAKVGRRYSFGDQVTMADAYLVPQMWNARRFDCDLKPFPGLRRIEDALYQLAPFDRARPENQPDAE